MKDWKERWIEALRNGGYEQGTGKLRHEDENTYCCLGVLAHAVLDIDDPGDLEREYIDEELLSNCAIELPICQRAFGKLNDDHGESFEEIARRLETNDFPGVTT